MRFPLFLIILVFLMGVVAFVYGFQDGMEDAMLLGVFLCVITLTLFIAWGKGKDTE